MGVALAALRRERGTALVRGMTTVDSGAACLAMVLGHHGRSTGLSSCVAAIGADARGTTLQAVARAAQTFGLRVRHCRVDADQLARAPSPLIAASRDGQFVVVERGDERAATILDPAVGRRRVGWEELADSLAGPALLLEPGDGFVPSRVRAPSPRWKAFQLLLGVPGLRTAFGQVVVASLALTAFGLVLPLFTAYAVDHLVPAGSTDALSLIGIGLLALVIGHVATGYARARLLLRLQSRIDRHVMDRFVEHLLALPYAFFQRRSTGDLLARLASSTVLRETLTAQTVAALIDGLLVGVYLVLLVVWSPLFAAIVAGFAVVEIVLLDALADRIESLSQRELAAGAREQGALVETLTGIETVKGSGGEARALARWRGLFDSRLALFVERGRAVALVEAVLSAIRIGAPLLLLWVGVWQVLLGHLSPGLMLELVLIGVACQEPLSELGSSVATLAGAVAHADRVADVLETEPERQGGERSVSLAGRVELEAVSFRYGAGSPLVLRDVSLALAPGETLAIVGPSGSGKSTLLGILLGLNEPAAGQVRYDGRAQAELSLAALRAQIGVVPQEVVLFAGSVADNLRFLDPDATDKELVAAARVAELHDEIVRLPMGYATWIGEGGTALSGGQRQRLALARALVLRPKLLVLDEPTSHLDGPTEARVLANLGRLALSRIIVAHRASTVRDADRVVVLHEGTVAESGTPAELLARGSLFCELVGERTGAPTSASNVAHVLHGMPCGAGSAAGSSLPCV